ncbi:MAG: sulfatase-like hydrolase/transferase, partial [Planctomycetota bacterium]
MRILYLDLDALNPSHLSCYGYPRQTSPTIDALAARGLRGTGVYCSDAPCLPSRTAFYAGRFGMQTGVVGHGRTAADPKPQGTSRAFKDRFTLDGLAGQLVQRGYHTAMISPFGDRHSAHHFYAGFREMHNTGKGGNEIVDDVEPVLDRWLNAHAVEDSWYLHLNYWDIHTAYRTPGGFGDPFKDAPIPDWFTDDLIQRHLKKTGPHSPLEIGGYMGAHDGFRYLKPEHRRYPDTIESLADLREWLNGYDAAIK